MYVLRADRRIIATYSTVAEAVEHLARVCFYYEEDADYPGCWDGMGKNGSVYSIEPKKGN